MKNTRQYRQELVAMPAHGLQPGFAGELAAWHAENTAAGRRPE
jgi:hypothetical protein